MPTRSPQHVSIIAQVAASVESELERDAMRRSVSNVLRVGSASLAVVVSLTIATQPLFAQSRDVSVEAQIERVATGILPPVLLQGETPATVSLLARMAELHVPAVSIAVVHDGKIAWARGFGVAKLGG